MLAERLPWCEPVEAAQRLRPLGGLAFLDSAMQHPLLGRWSYVAADPYARLTVEHGRALYATAAMERPGGLSPEDRSAHRPPDPEAPAAALTVLRRCLAEQSVPHDPDLPPFLGGALGVLSYEFGSRLEGLAPSAAGAWGGVPEVCLGFYDVVLAFDHQDRVTWLLSSGAPDREPARREDRARRRADRLQERLAMPETDDLRPWMGLGRDEWHSNFTPASYGAAVAAVVEAILDGEIFQANVAQRFMAATPGGFDPWRFYRRLRETNPAPFAAYLDLGDRVVASSSPELFLRLQEDRLETRPIKGTAARAPDPAQDRALAEALAASRKDRAENLMIVDLLRNDLSKVCRPHSVATPALCTVESYAGVHHLVSTVTGRLHEGTDAVDALAACFPGGSVTGAPKRQAMQVIARTEGEARGVYCGSIVSLGFDGSLIGNIAIRTVLFQGGRAVFHAGGGVTALSDPEAEYQESLAKAERIFRAFETEEE